MNVIRDAISSTFSNAADRLANRSEKFSSTSKIDRTGITVNHIVTNESDLIKKTSIMDKLKGTASRICETIKNAKNKIFEEKKINKNVFSSEIKHNQKKADDLNKTIESCFNFSIKSTPKQKVSSLKYTNPTAKALEKKGFLGLARLHQNKLEEGGKDSAPITKTDAQKGHAGINTLAKECNNDVDTFLKELDGYENIIYTAGGVEQFLDDIKTSGIVLSDEQKIKLLQKVIFLGDSGTEKPERGESRAKGGLPDTLSRLDVCTSFAIYRDPNESFEGLMEQTTTVLKEGAKSVQERIDNHKKNGHTENAILITCNKGQNRSSALNIMHEMVCNGKTFDKAYRHVMGKRRENLSCTVKDYLFLALQYEDIKKHNNGIIDKVNFGKVLIDFAAFNGRFTADKVLNLIGEYSADLTVRQELLAYVLKLEEKLSNDTNLSDKEKGDLRGGLGEVKKHLGK